jgi:para-nitrobenzyl esterase
MAAARDPHSVIVDLPGVGRLSGRRVDGCLAWLGIPYAEPPVGHLRFRAPRPVRPWPGVREAVDFGPACPQLPGLRPKTAGPRFDEDCLTLNVWSPAADDRRRPVMVWIHGGGFASGSGSAYDGALLASTGDIVIVTINYRLGVFGFVNFGDVLGDDAPDGDRSGDSPRGFEGNLGLRDQIAALRWVRDHIAAFGGDPDRVTVAGQSAGGISVSLLMLSPAAQPLFHGAIVQSGAPSLIHDAATSRRVARMYLEELQVDAAVSPAAKTLADTATPTAATATATTTTPNPAMARPRTVMPARRRSRAGTASTPSPAIADLLRAIDPARLLRAQQAVAKRMDCSLPAAPWFDGDLLPASFAEARTTPTPDIPLLAGSTRDEIRLFELMPGPKPVPTTREEVAPRLRAQLGEARTEAILAAYPATRKGQRALASDATFRFAAVHFAARHAAAGRAAWLYRFDAAHPLFGAMHGLDFIHLWNWTGWIWAIVRGGPLSGRRAALAARMRARWIAFVRDGTPGPDWPRLDTSTFQTLLFDLTDPGHDAHDRVVSDPDRERRIAWDGQDIMTGLDWRTAAPAPAAARPPTP